MSKNQITWDTIFKNETIDESEMIELTKELLKSSDVNEYIDFEHENYTPLNRAALGGFTEMARFLLENGADVNKPYYLGATSLHMAAQSGSMEIVRLLVENGADVNKPDSFGVTPLSTASNEGHTEIASFLLENGADVDGEHEMGGRSLHGAVIHGHTETTMLLLAKGANVDKPDLSGDNPLAYAVKEGYIEIVRLLVENGADINLSTLKHKTLDIICQKIGNPADGVVTEEDAAATEVHRAATKKDIIKALLQSTSFPLMIKTQEQKAQVIEVLVENPSLVPTKAPQYNLSSDSDINKAIEDNILKTFCVLQESTNITEKGLQSLILGYTVGDIDIKFLYPTSAAAADPSEVKPLGVDSDE